MAAPAYHVPGVYYEPRPRAAEEPVVRTDVAGFIGFDPRVRNGTTPSALVGSPPTAHAFRVDIAGFQVEVNAVRYLVPAATDFVLSAGPGVPLAAGQSIVYGLAVGESNGKTVVVAVAGAAATSTQEQPPDDGAVRLAVATALGIPVAALKRSLRLADVTVRRDVLAISVTSRPGQWLTATRCDDMRDFDLAFGTAVDDGTLLATAVRAFFSNGGRRCWVSTVRRPGFEDGGELAHVLEEIIGQRGSSELEATGLERLLLIRDVTVVDVPDLYARRVDRSTTTLPLPPSEREACFIPCTTLPAKGTATSNERTPALAPIFASSLAPFGQSDVFLTQARLVLRCALERWRVLLLLSVPLLPDGGVFVPPTDQDARAWVDQFDQAVKGAPGLLSLGDTEDVSCAAIYWPWLLSQERVDTPVLEVPPSAYAAGIIARRDLSRGPQVSPANETLREVVGATGPIDDAINAMLYDREPDNAGRPISAVNVVRPFPGYGIQIWGARTLSTEMWLRFISVRRTLTAIELRMKAVLDLLVFEPNRPALWLQVTQTAFGVLLPLFESGALRGERPEEAFYVRCDGRNNPPEALARGELLVEVGVAVAAPAEFIVFRVGRREGVIEVLE